MEGGPCCALLVGDHRRGGGGVESTWSTWIWRLGSGSSSSTKTTELRRLLLSLEIGGRWAVSSSSELRRPLFSGRWAVFDILLMTLLVERRQFGAAARDSARTSSSSWHIALWEAVLRKSGVQLSPASWRSGGPKWSVPGGARSESRLKQRFGPDRNPISCVRVLLAKN